MRVAGGVAPKPSHETFPVEQSAVAQENLPVTGLVEQLVRPQKRPDHAGGAARDVAWPG